MSELSRFVANHKRVAIDTNIFVYLVEASERYGELAKALFAWVKRSGNSAVASTIVVTELLVPLYKEASREQERSEIFSVLARYPNLEWIAADLVIADLAAQCRARYGLKTPDALHAATAIHAGATGFVTNDVSFNRVEEFETLQFEACFKNDYTRAA